MTTATQVEQAQREPPLIFTDAAATKVQQLIEQEGNDRLKLRVSIVGGGCNGFGYGFAFVEHGEDDDTHITNQGVTLLVDPLSVLYLEGAEIDFLEGVEGAQFVIRNPNPTGADD